MEAAEGRQDEREQKSKGHIKMLQQLEWRMSEGKKRGGRWMEKTHERWRDMAHLPLLSGCCEIAGFPRSAKCGSEFFPQLVSSHSPSHYSLLPHLL